MTVDHEGWSADDWGFHVGAGVAGASSPVGWALQGQTSTAVHLTSLVSTQLPREAPLAMCWIMHLSEWLDMWKMVLRLTKALPLSAKNLSPSWEAQVSRADWHSLQQACFQRLCHAHALAPLCRALRAPSAHGLFSAFSSWLAPRPSPWMTLAGPTPQLSCDGRQNSPRTSRITCTWLSHGVAYWLFQRPLCQPGS